MSSVEIPEFLRRVPIGESVTDRKWEVLGCIANGMEEKQIAQQLGISYYTVEAHIEQIHTGATCYSGAHRSTVLAPLIIKGVETGRIVVDNIPEDVVLTKRQLEVKGLMLSGYRIPDVANKLGILPISAELHFRNIYKKLRAKNYYHAVAKMVSYRLIKLGQLYQDPNPAPQLAVPVTNS